MEWIFNLFEAQIHKNQIEAVFAVVDTCENETATNSKLVIVQEFSIRISMFTYMWCHLRIETKTT